MPEVETSAVSEERKHDGTPRKRLRHRKKLIYGNILKQMEFYFSDANLIKDRFLGDLVKKDPYVPLETFLKFNKIRNMTQDVNDIAKAMKHSKLLELSEDKSKVKRKVPLQPYDADARTVYVESIPVTATREWLEKVFSDYGPIAYLSLPKFKNSQKIKGYAFIEFASPDDAKECLNTFTKLGCKLPTHMSPGDLSSIKTFSVDEDPGVHQKVVEEYEPPKKKKKNKDKRPKGLDLKVCADSDNDKKLDTPTYENKSITTPTEEVQSTDIESKNEISSQDETIPADGDQTTPKKKKSRKRTKENKYALGKNEAPKGALWGLQVLPKSEWKALRNKYLNLQRKYMKDLKKELQKKRLTYSNYPPPAAPPADLEPALPSSECQDEKQVVKLERIPGVFVKEILPEPCLDVRLTKRTIRSNVHVSHVDVKEGQTEVIIRFDSPKAANDYCNNSGNPSRVLSEVEEEEQWVRAENARAAKRPRGRVRLLAQSARVAAAPVAPASPQPTHTHIRFDDE